MTGLEHEYLEIKKLMEEASFFADKKSSDSETKVGAVAKLRLRDNNLIIARAANTFIANTGKIKLPSTRPDKYQYIIHAEQNLIFQAAKMGLPMEGVTVVCTLSPCQSCIRALWQAGVKRIWYKELYRAHNTEMLDLKVDTKLVYDLYLMEIQDV